MKLYNKLVRDRIPEIMEANGDTPILRTLEAEEYRACLEAKLDEEVREFHESKEPDILEVVYTLAETYGCSREKLDSLYQTKHDARGGFVKRVFLIGKTENNEKT